VNSQATKGKIDINSTTQTNSTASTNQTALYL